MIFQYIKPYRGKNRDSVTDADEDEDKEGKN